MENDFAVIRSLSAGRNQKRDALIDSLRRRRAILKTLRYQDPLIEKMFKLPGGRFAQAEMMVSEAARGTLFLLRREKEGRLPAKRLEEITAVLERMVNRLSGEPDHRRFDWESSYAQDRPQIYHSWVLPEEVKFELTKAERTGFCSRFENLIRRIEERFAERLQLAAEGSVECLGREPRSREWLEFLVKQKVPATIQEITDAIERKDERSFYALRYKIESTARLLDYAGSLNSKEERSYKEHLQPLLKQMDHRAREAATQRLKKFDKELSKNRDALFWIQIIDIKKDRVCQAKFLGLTFTLTPQQAPYLADEKSREMWRGVNVVFPAQLQNLDWADSAPKPVFSVREAQQEIISKMRAAKTICTLRGIEPVWELDKDTEKRKVLGLTGYFESPEIGLVAGFLPAEKYTGGAVEDYWEITSLEAVIHDFDGKRIIFDMKAAKESRAAEFKGKDLFSKIMGVSYRGNRKDNPAGLVVEFEGEEVFVPLAFCHMLDEKTVNSEDLEKLAGKEVRIKVRDPGTKGNRRKTARLAILGLKSDPLVREAGRGRSSSRGDYFKYIDTGKLTQNPFAVLGKKSSNDEPDKASSAVEDEYMSLLQRRYDRQARMKRYKVHTDLLMQAAAEQIFSLIEQDFARPYSVLDIATGTGLMAGNALSHGAASFSQSNWRSVFLTNSCLSLLPSRRTGELVSSRLRPAPSPGFSLLSSSPQNCGGTRSP